MPNFRKRLRRTKFTQIIQYLSLRYLETILSVFRLKVALQIGKIVGQLVYLIDTRHRKVAYDNIYRAIGKEFTDYKIKSIVKNVYKHIGMGIVELIFTQRFTRGNTIREYVKLEKFHIIDNILSKKNGVIVVIAHLGNWELAGLAVPNAGYPLTSVARPIENPYVDRYLNKFRSSMGQEILPKYNALKDMVSALKKNNILVILADQNVRKGGVFVDFFGIKASTTKSPALLSLKYNIPIVPVNIYREEKTLLHKVVITEPIYPQVVDGCDDKIERLTALYTSRLEQFIKEHIDQWMWLHRRWKTRPSVEKINV